MRTTTMSCAKHALGFLLGVVMLPVTAPAQASPLAIETGAASPLRLHGVTVAQSANQLVVSGRISRALRQSVLPATVLRLELRGADGSVKESATGRLSAIDLPRRSARDARFRLALERAPASGEALVLVLNPRRG